jgi:hypothetical protein
MLHRGVAIKTKIDWPALINELPLSRTWQFPSCSLLHTTQAQDLYSSASRANCCANTSHSRSVRDTSRNILQSYTHCTFSSATRMTTLRTADNSIIINDSDIKSGQESLADMICKELEWQRHHR